jgi:ABC-type polysaccharide/polyol phosphate transport system ATPase subunit
MKPILEIQHLSKKFLINKQQGAYLSLREKLSGMFNARPTMEEFWALKDISFEVMSGESLGIIGKNGAGKSTLLKLLSHITPPTTGKIIERGRIASLLEVGTGFHYELTGRENIFMNGSILGMKKSEIKSKFDEIVDFSGTEKFIDTPLKHYSSGMQLRLAFAVAAYLDPEILIIDEVLAVGDAEFQKKCMSKMEDVTGQGRTILFVSHSLPSLKAICKTGVMLQNGELVKRGTIDEVVNFYTSLSKTFSKAIDGICYRNEGIKIHHFSINGGESNTVTVIDGRIILDIEIEFLKRTTFGMDVHVKKDDVRIASYSEFVKSEVERFEPGKCQLSYAISIPSFRSGKYKIDIFFSQPFVLCFASTENLIELDIVNSNHHTLLNERSLQWGSLLLDGDVISRKENSK